MAEFCLNCFNKNMMGNIKALKEQDVILSDDWCEECMAWKPCVVMIKPKTFSAQLKRRYSVIKFRLKAYMQNTKESHKK